MLPDSIQIGFAFIHLKSLKGHYFNDFTGVLLLLPIIEWTSIETCIGQNCKLGLFFCSKSLVSCSNFKVIVRGGVEDIRLEAKDTKKNPRPKTNPLEAKDRNACGQGHRHRCSPKHKVTQNNFLGDLQILMSFSGKPQNFKNSKNSAVLEPRSGQF